MQKKSNRKTKNNEMQGIKTPRLLNINAATKKGVVRTSIFNQEVLTNIQDDISELVTPIWITKPLSDFGQASAGSMKADEWRVLATIYLPLTCIKLWGNSPPESFQRQALEHFIDLAISVKLCLKRSQTIESSKRRSSRTCKLSLVLTA